MIFGAIIQHLSTFLTTFWNFPKVSIIFQHFLTLRDIFRYLLPWMALSQYFGRWQIDIILNANEPNHYIRALKLKFITTLRIEVSHLVFVLGGIIWFSKTVIPSGNCCLCYCVVVPNKILAGYSYPSMVSCSYHIKDILIVF